MLESRKKINLLKELGVDTKDYDRCPICGDGKPRELKMCENCIVDKYTEGLDPDVTEAYGYHYEQGYSKEAVAIIIQRVLKKLKVSNVELKKRHKKFWEDLAKGRIPQAPKKKKESKK